MTDKATAGNGAKTMEPNGFDIASMVGNASEQLVVTLTGPLLSVKKTSKNKWIAQFLHSDDRMGVEGFLLLETVWNVVNGEEAVAMVGKKVQITAGVAGYGDGLTYRFGSEPRIALFQGLK